MNRKQIGKWLDEALGLTLLCADGLDEAFLGVDWNNGDPRAVYSIEMCIEILARDMSHEEADEYFWYNTAGAYVGPQTPIFIHTPIKPKRRKKK